MNSHFHKVISADRNERQDGTDGVYTICKEIVKLLPHRSKKLNSVKSILSGHGDFITTTGEFGMSEYYKKQKEMMLTWCQDKNMKVQKFAKKLLEDMANNIADSRRREENSMELLKREY